MWVGYTQFIHKNNYKCCCGVRCSIFNIDNHHSNIFKEEEAINNITAEEHQTQSIKKKHIENNDCEEERDDRRWAPRKTEDVDASLKSWAMVKVNYFFVL